VLFRSRRGEIRNFTGIDDPYEPPIAPDLVLDTSRLTVEEAGEQVWQLIARSRAGAGTAS